MKITMEAESIEDAIGLALLDLRRSAEMSQDAVAKALGVHQSSVCKRERGYTSEITIAQLVAHLDAIKAPTKAFVDKVIDYAPKRFDDEAHALRRVLMGRRK